MFCPKCGKGELQANSYCRACGEWLPDLTRRGRKSFGGDSPDESLQISLVLSAITALVALILAVLLYATFFGRSETLPIIYVTAAFLVAIAAWQASNFYVALKLRRNFKRHRVGAFAPNSKELNETKQNAALPEADTSRIIRPTTSVTENTTELLEPIPQKRNNS